MKPQIVHMGPSFDVCMDVYKRDFEVQHVLDTNALTPADRTVASHVEAVISYAPQRAHNLEVFPRLKFIASFGAGYDKLDMRNVSARGITLTNTPGATDECVADMAMMLVLATMRQLIAGHEFVRNGGWQSSMFPVVHSANGRRMGILGLGRIGKAIARRALSFNMPITYHNRTPVADCPFEYCSDPVALAEQSDILVVSCSGGEGTRHLVSKRVLRALGQEGILVNVSRGSVVDEAALISVLQSRQIAGAGLDVFAKEPLANSPLLEMTNVTLMPHRGSATFETFEKMALMVSENLRSFFAGRPPPNPVFVPAQTATHDTKAVSTQSPAMS